ncbi:TVP38/TMEM64 family protein [Corynebacterium pseudopelargi]|uniref:TVP38/TMEM64 family membrane protein n=1 Tax=Corynebacterium pseudopelargi TaxID=2080757 RepID=A0A3G6IU22_9CORY|nr:TVP38/TMEM64 family protein [Corynebacterium pseudopelargi]AZA09251.1 TVP38/TMEM64 family inner membrane protein YdjZ [Corynebacterium pseudopelargi]
MSSFFRRVLGTARDGLNTFSVWPRWRQAAAIIAVIALCVIVAFVDAPSLATLQQWATSTGAWFPALFFLLYVLITQFPIPRTVMTLSAGVLFGPKLGIALALAATTCSAALSLLLVRSLFGPVVIPLLRHPQLDKINARLEQRGWLAVTSLRMIAAVPFSILNYAAAFSAVGVVAFSLATLIGSMPGTVITVILGDSLISSANPVALLAVVMLAALGVLGILLDTRMPVKAEP